MIFIGYQACPTRLCRRQWLVCESYIYGANLHTARTVTKYLHLWVDATLLCLVFFSWKCYIRQGLHCFPSASLWIFWFFLKEAFFRKHKKFNLLDPFYDWNCGAFAAWLTVLNGLSLLGATSSYICCLCVCVWDCAVKYLNPCLSVSLSLLLIHPIDLNK